MNPGGYIIAESWELRCKANESLSLLEFRFPIHSKPDKFHHPMISLRDTSNR
jgi:hypothetical protein